MEKIRYSGVNTLDALIAKIKSEFYSKAEVDALLANMIMPEGLRKTYSVAEGIAGITIIKQPESMTAYAGDTVTFSVEAMGVASYQWQFSTDDGATWNNLTWAGNNTATMTRTININTVTYQYRCKLTGMDGSVLYTDIVEFASPIIITKQPKDVTAAVGETAVFTVEAVGNGLTYQWKLQTKSGTTWTNSGATGATTNEVTFNVQSHQDGFKYCCEITDVNGNVVTTDVATLTLS